MTLDTEASVMTLDTEASVHSSTEDADAHMAHAEMQRIVALADKLFPSLRATVNFDYLADHLVREILQNIDRVAGMTFTLQAGIGLLTITDGKPFFTSAVLGHQPIYYAPQNNYENIVIPSESSERMASITATQDDYATVVEALKTADLTDERWAALQEEHRLIEGMLELHQNQTPCWKNRQKGRLVIGWKKITGQLPPVGGDDARIST
jgi:hypothetical protein